jgi:hypothetical protein
LHPLEWQLASLHQIHAELANVVWVPRDGLSITVKDGVVDLNGVVLEEREREALRVVAENVAGVKAVEDHLVWIERVSGIVIDPRQDERGPDRTFAFAEAKEAYRHFERRGHFGKVVITHG